MPGREGWAWRPDGRACPAIAQRREIGDRRCEERRLCVRSEVERLGRTFPRELADRFAEGVVRLVEHGRGSRRGGGEGLSHADGLGSLAGKHECGGHALLRWAW